MVLKETAAASHIASREARINMILREMKLRNGLLLDIDLTSSDDEREVRHKQIEAELRARELDQACKGGWACEAQESLEMVNIYEVKLNINLNAQSLEQLNESRKVCISFVPFFKSYNHAPTVFFIFLMFPSIFSRVRWILHEACCKSRENICAASSLWRP